MTLGILVIEDGDREYQEMRKTLKAWFPQAVVVQDRTGFEHKQILQIWKDNAITPTLILADTYLSEGQSIKKVMESVQVNLQNLYPETSLPPVVLCSGDLGRSQTFAQDLIDKTGFCNNILAIQKDRLAQEVAVISAMVNLTPETTITNAAHLASAQIPIQTLLDSFQRVQNTQLDSVAFRSLAQQADPNEILDIFRNHVVATEEQKEKAIPFPIALGQSISGRAAFSWQDVDALKQEDADAPIVLITHDGGVETIHNLPMLEGHGIVVLGERASHFRIIARAFGLSGLMNDNPDKGMLVLHEEDGFLYLPASGESINRGEWLTLDTQSLKLYPERCPVEPANPNLTQLDALGGWLVQHKPDNTLMPHMAFAAQVDSCHDMTAPFLEKPFCRMENFFLFGDGERLLQNVLLDPTTHNLRAAQDHVATHLAKTFQSMKGQVYRPCFRLPDIKPDQIFPSLEDQEKLTQKWNVVSARGAELAPKIPSFYRAMAEAVFMVMPDYSDTTYPLHLIVPRTENAQQLSDMMNLVAGAANPRQTPYQMSAMIETRGSIQEIRPILKQLYKQEGEPHLFIGTNDLTEELLGGIGRQEDKKISTWMHQNEFDKNPFLVATPHLRTELETLMHNVKAEGKKHLRKPVVSVCGEHATSLPFLEFIYDLGIGNVSVPPQNIFLKGLQPALYLQKFQRGYSPS